MKKMLNVAEFSAKNDSSNLNSDNLKFFTGGGTTKKESHGTNWESQCGCDTEHWTYSDNGRALSAVVVSCEGCETSIL